MREGGELVAVEGDAALALELGGHTVGKGEIHIVTAQEGMLADRDALQLQLAAVIGDRDQAQVGGATADVADQHDIAVPDLVTPGLAMLLEPGVEGRLWFLEQADGEARRGGRLHRQFAGHGVEGGRHRQQHRLRLQAEAGVACGHAVIPGLAQVLEVEPGGGDRADAARRLGAAEGQALAAAVDAVVAQPGLGGGNDLAGLQRGLVAGEGADGHVGGFARVPGQAQSVGDHVLGTGQVGKARQQRQRRHFAGGHQLRDQEDLRPALRRRFRQVDIGQGRIRGPEVDADDVARILVHGLLRDDRRTAAT